MKKILRALIILFILYYVYQLVFTYFQGGHDIDYSISSEDYTININEKSFTRLKEDEPYYKFTINVNDSVFSFHSLDNFEHYSYVIEDVKYFKDNTYECIYVDFKNDSIINDVLCKNKDNIMINYSIIDNASDELNKFVDGLVKDGYDRSSFKVSKKTSEYFDTKVYVKNLISGHFVGMSFTNGVYRINTIDKMQRVIDFEGEFTTKDIKVVTFMENMFFVLDYSKISNNARMFVNNITDKSSKTMIFNTTLSEKTYIIGKHDTSIYLFDPTNLKEYEIDYSNDIMLEVGNVETGLLYYDGDEKKRTNITNVGNILFYNQYKSDYKNDKYARIDKVGQNHGFYYYYEKNGNEYIIYRADINDKDNLTYIGKSTNINKSIYAEDYIYYVYNDKLYVYGDKVGSKPIISGNDLINDNYSKFGLYIK